MKITRAEHDYILLIHEDDTLYLTIKADDEIVELEGMKGYLYYYSECVDEEDIDASPKLTLKEMQDYAREVFSEWNIEEERVEALISDLTPWFENYAISGEEKIAQEIAELEEMIAGRRETIKNVMHSIEEDNSLIAKVNRRIELNTKEVIGLNSQIDDYEKKIAALKASLKGVKFVSVDPEYTGGGIYVFTGELTDGNFFMADTSFYDVRIVDADPSIPADMSDDEVWEKYGITRDEDAWASVEWQEEHLVEDLIPDKAVAFFKEMLKWVKKNKPNGNYCEQDMDFFREDLESILKIEDKRREEE